MLEAEPQPTAHAIRTSQLARKEGEPDLVLVRVEMPDKWVNILLLNASTGETWAGDDERI